jgi:hypothetical protein
MCHANRVIAPGLPFTIMACTTYHRLSAAVMMFAPLEQSIDLADSYKTQDVPE